ncbi:DUF4262 domain-containing protein [Microvirga makkahensis]|uniref:DUF4262 domain-containing protein n=1 Tax=Microvirga makkahensis TaxID=1128670 RepID=A0A7X3SMN8_9HYPH|nr:DUF4262 domain-containing protein [Microvirga makkahensis]MXQ10445.1 DUF4262 domain-containing protein [Microvirga makkahensis]
MADRIDDYVRKARAIVRQYGWMVQGVLPNEGQPSYSYSVGLSKHSRHPEIFLVGFHPDVARSLINVTGGHVKAGLRFDHPMLSDQIIEGCPAAFRPVTRKSCVRHSSAGRAILGRAFDGVQLFLPDAAGVFPWEEGCDSAYATGQTSLLALEGAPPVRQ